MADVFVSYAREDSTSAELLVSTLIEHGWTVFWDRTIPAGKQWDDVLKLQLERARCVLVLWSIHSLQSEWVLHEASVARHRGVLVPALLQPVLDKDARIAAVFGSIQAVSLLNLSAVDDSRLKDLVREVERLIGRPRKALKLALITALAALLVLNARAGFDATTHFVDDLLRKSRNEDTMRRAGVKWISWGPFDSEENARNFRLVREARTVDMIVTNATLFVSNFRTDLKTFFNHPDAHMRVIFASPETPFYEQMAKMTGRIWESADARKEDILRIERSRQELLSDTMHDSQIEFKYFDTQYRMPIILIDGKYCILTVRLPPDEGQESLRIESDDSGLPTAASAVAASPRPRLLRHVAESCKTHFERMWAQTSTMPVKPN